MRSHGHASRMMAWAGALLIAGFIALGMALAAGPVFDPSRPIRLLPTIPADVDPAVRSALLARGEILLAHRLFEQQQWAVFVALNWPVDAAGKPRPSLGSPGQPRWSNWIETYQVFKPAGAAPDTWDDRTRSLPLADKVQMPLPNEMGAVPLPPIDSRTARVLHNRSSIQKLNVADEVNQAFSFAIWDQNGNPVHYESLLNRVEYDFIVEKGLYEAGGLAAYLAKVGKLTFPAGRFAGNKLGAIELKLAWRILDPATDDFSRYLTQPAYVASGGDTPTWTQVVVGLVGFHIAQKTETSPQWIWSTFEHVDNVAVDRLTSIKTADGKRRALRASFNNPDCEWCPVNVPVPPGADGKRRTQIARLVPIRPETAALNRRMRAALKAAGSKLQFYEMIGTQWPTDPAAPPQAGAAFPGAVTNLSGGKPLPVYLVNSVMETFSQVGNLPAREQPRAVSTSSRPVFGNGSCMGCHASSPYDFSWIMTKAQRKPPAQR
jgi:hypothetical protein